MFQGPLHDPPTRIDHRGSRTSRKWLRRSVALLAATMFACGGDDATTATSDVSTTTSAPAAVTSSVPEVSSVPTTAPAARTAGTTAPVAGNSSPSTTVGPGAACPISPIPTGATDVTGPALGRFDGDGQTDALMAYKSAGVWYLRAELSSGGNVDVAVPNVGVGDTVRPAGGFDIGGNASDEAFATVGSGAYAKIVGVWNSGGFCQLTRFTVNGQPSEFPVGASVGNRVGLSCVPGTALQAREMQANNTGTQYTGSVKNYDVVGTTLVLGLNTPQTLGAGDPGLALYSAFACGSLTVP